MMKYKKLIVPAAAAFALVFSAAATASGWKLQNGSVPTRLVHAVNGEDLGLSQDLPVDIRIGYKCVAKNVPFRTVAEGPLLRPGVHQVRITLANSRRGCRGTLVMADTIDVNFGDSLSLVAHQTDDGGIRITKFNDDLRDAGPSNGRATVRHTADAPAVDIIINKDATEPAITDLTNGNGSKLDAPADTYTVEIAPAGGDPLNPPGEIPLPVTAGENIIVYAIGSLGTGSFDLLVDVLPLQ